MKRQSTAFGASGSLPPHPWLVGCSISELEGTAQVHFTDEEAEAQKGTCLRPPCEVVAELGLGLGRPGRSSVQQAPIC